MIFLVALLGLVFGSFLNVLIYRLPIHKSIAFPASHCPKCSHKLAWYDNIPVVSYLLLKGKCRYCKEGISPRYLMVELINGGLWSLAYYAFGFNGLMVLACIFIAICLVITFIDLEHMIIPDSMNLGILTLGLINIFLPNRIESMNLSITWIDQLIGFGFGVGFLLLIILVR
jgi:prepilin signal peptidase PulO-like enzyme (type II secretory pathway)